MKEYTFTPNFEVIAAVDGMASIADLEKEVGMYSASPGFLMKHGGIISRQLLDAVPEWYFAEAASKGLFPNIDVRIHRLYPGDFPAYPGWHCDGEFRETYFSQPDMDRINVSKHITCTVSSVDGGVSNTEFLCEPFTARIVNPGVDHTLWGQVHRQLSAQSAHTALKTRTAQDGELVLFDPWSLHRATPARIRGWRLFFRMSMWHRPNLGDGGMLTKQEQVYTVEGPGW